MKALLVRIVAALTALADQLDDMSSRIGNMLDELEAQVKADAAGASLDTADTGEPPPPVIPQGGGAAGTPTSEEFMRQDPPAPRKADPLDAVIGTCSVPGCGTVITERKRITDTIASCPRCGVGSTVAKSA